MDDQEDGFKAAFNWAFPGFLDSPIELRQTGGRPRRRRFSGGLFSASAPLPKGRYHSVCVHADGGDVFGVCNELSAYRGATTNLGVWIVDAMDSSAEEEMTRLGVMTGRPCVSILFADPQGEVAARYFSIGGAGQVGPGKLIVNAPYIVEAVEIPDVIDLRLPSTQRWFFDTFRFGYGDFWRKAQGGDAERFEHMLPALMTTEIGGSQVTDAIGCALRGMGAAALIYPSARCDPEIVVEGGELKRWCGFNLVDFRDARLEDAMDIVFDDSAPWSGTQFFDGVAMNVADLSPDRALAERIAGSWRILGVVKAHEEFYSQGGVLGGREGLEWKDAPVSKTAGEFARAIYQRVYPVGAEARHQLPEAQPAPRSMLARLFGKRE